jgi:hypothetical protein
MPTVSERPPGATAPPAPQVDLADHDARSAWLAAACEAAADLLAAARDMAAPPDDRMLGRRAAREHVDDAGRSLASLFAAVGLNLDTPPVAIQIGRVGEPGEGGRP